MEDKTTNWGRGEPIKTIDILLNSTTNKRCGNYRIEFVAPRAAFIYHYNMVIAKVNYGDNYGRGRSFSVAKKAPSVSTARAINYIRKTLTEAGFIELNTN